MYNKKWISFVFLFALLFSNVGLAYNIHYCQGQIEKISLAYTHDHTDTACKKMGHKSPQKDCCKKPEVQQKEDCCKDSVVTQQPTDKNFVKTFPIQLDHYILPEPWNPLDALSNIPQEHSSTALLFYCDSHAPPLFKLYCQLIFYA